VWHAPAERRVDRRCAIVGALATASVVADWGPRNNKTELPQLLAETRARLRVRDLYADAGYDAEWIHVWCRQQAGIRSWIPAGGASCERHGWWTLAGEDGSRVAGS
jgi:hypothetical protein